MSDPHRDDFEALADALQNLDADSGNRILLMGGVAITYRPSKRERFVDRLKDIGILAVSLIQGVAIVSVGVALALTTGSGPMLLAWLAFAVMWATAGSVGSLAAMGLYGNAGPGVATGALLGAVGAIEALTGSSASLRQVVAAVIVSFGVVVLARWAWGQFGR